MDLKHYFNPINLEVLDFFNIGSSNNQIGNHIGINDQEKEFPSLEGIKIAIIGVPEEKNAYENKGCSLAPDEVRRQLFQLYKNNDFPAIADLGNFKTGKTADDTYIALSEILAYIIEKGILPIIIGGSQDITYANYYAYEQLNQVINIVSIDSRFDIGNEQLPFASNTYLHKIILKQPNFLFNFSNIGYQTYLVDNQDIELMDKLYFDAYRLGKAQEDIIECEPILRNADILTLDMSSVRFSDSPGCKHVTPNGFTGKEICQLVKYAGANPKLSSFGIYEFNPAYDIADQSAKLIAQIIWYFIEGYIIRQNDMLDIIKNNFFKYYVSLHENAYEIIFYKSKITELWWMEIPCVNKNPNYNRHYIIPCSLKDYETACQNEIPERWFQTLKKIKL